MKNYENPRILALFKTSIDPSTLSMFGRYTVPRSYGVYKINQVFHFGNHPVREKELFREYGFCELVVVLAFRKDAEELSSLLNLETAMNV